MSGRGLTKRAIVGAISGRGAHLVGEESLANGLLALNWNLHDLKFSTLCAPFGARAGTFGFVLGLALFTPRSGGAVSADFVNDLNKRAQLIRWVRGDDGGLSVQLGYNAVDTSPDHLGLTVDFWLGEMAHELSS